MCGAQTVTNIPLSVVGLGFSNCFEPIAMDDQYTMGHALLMLVIDMVILMLICWYVDAIYPGGEAVPQKPWFPFLVCFS